MTQTVQLCSLVLLSEEGKDLTIYKPEIEDDIKLLLSVFDGLNNLCEKLNRLNYIIQNIKIKNIEQIIYSQNKGEAK